MKKKEKTSLILTIYNVLSKAKYGQMADEDKIRIWKIARVLKPYAIKFEEDSRDAAEKFKPYDEFSEDLQKAQAFERLRNTGGDMEQSAMGAAEYEQFIEAFKKYNRLVNDAVSEFAEKEVELEFECIGEDAFGKLISSNEWTVEQTIELGEVVMSPL